MLSFFCRQRGRMVKVPGSWGTRSRFKTHSPHSVVFFGKTLYDTFPCVVVLASSSKLQSYLYYKRTAISWYLRKQVWVIAYPMYWHLRRFPASQEDKYRYKIYKNSSPISLYMESLKNFSKEMLGY